MYDLIIIGGGPAGMTAGIYAARQKLNTLLIAKSFGGQLTRKAVAIENYPGFQQISGSTLIHRFLQHLKKFKIKNVQDIVTKIEKEGKTFLVKCRSKKIYRTLAVVVASGADPRFLGIPGEKKFIGHGLSYCSVCDGPLFGNKTVAVIGGGDAGFEAALFLANYVKKIYILEYNPEVKAAELIQEKLKRTRKAEIITNANLKRIKGKKFVDSIIYQDRKSKKMIELKVKGVFIEIGSQPATSFAQGLVDFNKRNEIKVEFETYQTKTPGLFAVGDVNVGQYKQIITACGEGAKAALAAYNYLQKKR